jgi:hypothetical protein
MSRICVGCGRSFSFRGYNAHHSRPDAPPQCKGRNHERIAKVSVNARNYRVSLQGGVDDDLPEDSDAGAAARAASPSPGPGPGPGPPGNMHVTVM